MSTNEKKPGDQYELDFPVEESTINFKEQESYILNPFLDLTLEHVSDILRALKITISGNNLDPESQNLIDRNIFIKK